MNKESQSVRQRWNIWVGAVSRNGACTPSNISFLCWRVSHYILIVQKPPLLPSLYSPSGENPLSDYYGERAITISTGFWPLACPSVGKIFSLPDKVECSLASLLFIPASISFHFLPCSAIGRNFCRTRIDRMAFGQPERTCLNIQNVPLL